MTNHSKVEQCVIFMQNKSHINSNEKLMFTNVQTENGIQNSY